MKKVLELLFKKISKEFNHKPSKIWVDEDDEFFNKSMK